MYSGRVALEDTTLNGARFQPGASSENEAEKFTTPIPAGSLVLLDLHGAQLNRSTPIDMSSFTN